MHPPSRSRCRSVTALRQRRSLVFWAVFPALMLLPFGSIYRAQPSLRVGFDTTPAGILIGAALFFSCLGGTVSIIVAERERRMLRRLLVSLLDPVAYSLGIVMALSVVAAGQALIVYGLGHVLGAQHRGSVPLSVLIVALSVVAHVGLGFFFGARFAKRAEDVNGPVAVFGVPLLMLGGTFFPVTLLPASVLAVAQFDPVFHMNEALKAVAGRGAGLAEIRGHVVFLVVFAVLALGLGIASYRRMLAGYVPWILPASVATIPSTVRVTLSPNTSTNEKTNTRAMPGLSSRRPATKLIIRGIIANTQGLDAVSAPPSKTATTASQGLVWVYCPTLSMIASLTRHSLFAAAVVSQATISDVGGIRPAHLTSPFTTIAGVATTPNLMISSIFSILTSAAGTPDARMAFSVSA